MNPTNMADLKLHAKSIRQWLAEARQKEREALSLRMRAAALMSAASGNVASDEHVEMFYVQCGLSKASAELMVRAWDEAEIDSMVVRHPKPGGVL